MTPNPYLDGRREWLERYGDYITAARNWRLVAFAAMAVALLATSGLVFLSTQHKIVPYVVAVDRLGNELAVGRADVAAEADERVVRSMLARWVVNVRTVYLDTDAQRGLIKEAYQYIDSRSPAYEQLNAWFREHNPFDELEAIQPKIISVLKVSGDSWRIEWEELRAEGEAQTREEYQATVTVAISPPTDERVAVINPLGVYISYFQWGVRL